MKKYLTFPFLLCFYFAIAQKNTIKTGISAFNHFEGYGFKMTDGFKARGNALMGLASALSLGYERHFDDKNSIIVGYNIFYHTYQSVQFIRNPGIAGRRIVNLNTLYKRRIGDFWKNRLNVFATGGFDFRVGADKFFWGYIINGAQKKSKETELTVTDLGLPIGINTRMQIDKKLSLDLQCQYIHYVLGYKLYENYSGLSRSKQVFCVTLALGHSF